MKKLLGRWLRNLIEETDLLAPVSVDETVFCSKEACVKKDFFSYLAGVHNDY